MRKQLKDYKYDTILFPTDWRYAAAIIGLKQYFDFWGQEFHGCYEIFTVTENCNLFDNSEELLGFEGLAYRRENIIEKNYLLFAEYFFGSDMQHTKVEKKLKKEEFTEEEIREVNSLLTGTEANTILKKVFKGIKFDGTNPEQIIELLENNRSEIIKETFRNKMSMYRNFANVKLLFSEHNLHCRLLGFNVDRNRKSKSTSYNFDTRTLVTTDCLEFDFIPFAFTKSYDAVMINNNYSIDLLMQTYNKINAVLDNLSERQNIKVTLLKTIADSISFLKYDVEVIVKERDKEYYESLFIRKSAISAMEKITKKLVSKHKEFGDLKFRLELGKDYWLDVQEEIVDCCLNSLGFEKLIEKLLKIKEIKGVNRLYLHGIINILIELDWEWKGEINKMENEKKLSEGIKRAKNCAFVVASSIPENKLCSYRQKLISALVFHDYDRVSEIILQLSAYASVSMPFAYKFFENPEQNKNLVFAFANGLEKYMENKEK
ncbi:MAG: type I CRISPR-associated protein Cas8a1/Csx8 [Eubacterium sp.]|nr:type I CRISPR-associated protein Cas8a1/Csx8 [Eubacterium sp.]